MIVLCDTREQKPHPWAALLPSGWGFERVTLESGDFALASHPHGVTVERKTPSDMAGCIGADRERFERELRRSRYSGRFVVVIEGSLNDVPVAARGIHHNAVLGTLASWTLRYCPFVFAGSRRLAAEFAWRLLASQLPSGERRSSGGARLKQTRRALAQTQEGSEDEPPF